MIMDKKNDSKYSLKEDSEKKGKLRIFSAGDIHGDSLLAERLAKEAGDKHADLVVLCGDLTFAERSTDNIIGPFKKRNLKVLIIPGNHESVATTDFLAKVYDVKNLHGYSAKYKHVGLFGAGGANIGIDQLSEKELYDLLKKGFEEIKGLDKKIMVTHVHPSGTTMEKLSAFIPGSSGIRRAVDKFQPDILLCSHIHEAEGLEEKIGRTRVINVGKRGKIFDI
jgi:Icc-related predicted phosphoesterase